MTKNERIEPRTLRGFRDYLPVAALPRERMMETARTVFRSFGFAPIDTPALEYAEVLVGKGGAESDKQLYRFEDQGGRDVGLRFDLTVPFARFAAQHIGTLGTPFKRYHIGPVWRGENTQRGRYREFVQCDFDTIGTTSVLADAETALVIHELLCALGFDRFTIHLNNRSVLSGLLERLEAVEQAVPILRALDKLAKIGPDKVCEEMERTAGVAGERARAVLDFAGLRGSNEEVLERAREAVAGSETGERGVERLGLVLAALSAAEVPSERVVCDLAIARGLAYYTGTVYETLLGDLPGIGSVCSGGRYDDLASVYTKEQLPGVGASLGLDRLLAAMEELGLTEEAGTPAGVFIPFFVEERGADYLALGAELRRRGLACEVYPDARKLGAQLKYADRRGHRFAVIVGDDEWQRGTCQLKDLAAKASTEVALTALAQEIKART